MTIQHNHRFGGRSDGRHFSAHALQDVSFTLDRGILAVVGRNGMGKTTLCNAITGLVAASGSVKLAGSELVGRVGSEPTVAALTPMTWPQTRRFWADLGNTGEPGRPSIPQPSQAPCLYARS